jgi:hypothetical protein
MRQRTSLAGALSATVFAAACALALGVGWADWQRLARLPAARPAVGPAPAATPDDAPAADRAAALARLPEVALFGSLAAQSPEAGTAAPPRVDEAELPEASAGFQVFGLIEAAQPGRAWAILGTSDTDQREYRVGDETPDGARVHAIRPRGLVLERDGRLELVKLPEASTGEGEAPAVRPRFMPRPVARLGLPTTAVVPAGDEAAALAPPPPEAPPPDSP